MTETSLVSYMLCCLSCGRLGNTLQKVTIVKEAARQTQLLPFFRPPNTHSQLAIDSCVKEKFDVDNFLAGCQLA
ncbi:MAG: hypothetical protein GY821_04165 [Gammaproteobacteria bacterium]|nr:hypothetical protein [Gammaproteobacteria bacterium]